MREREHPGRERVCSRPVTATVNGNTEKRVDRLRIEEVPRWTGAVPRVVDETLRDGLQSASVLDPSIEAKIELLHAMAALGVDVVSVGLPAAGARAEADAARLAREIVDAKLGMIPTGAARTTKKDVYAVARASEHAGTPIEVYAFIGTSPIRQYVENWDMAFLLARVQEACEAAREAGLPFCLVTEDTTRTPPAAIALLYKAAVDAGASRLCLCDTVGHADPHGSRALVEYVRATLLGIGATHIGLDWHGHNDRGLALGNAIAAVQAGVGRVHGTALGLGERTGNARMEHLLLALESMGARPARPAAAYEHFEALAARALGAASDGLVVPASAPDPTPSGVPPAPRNMSRETGDVVEPLTPMTLRVNGETVQVAVRPSRTLLEMLRYDLDLIATKQGCDKGDCGACTVILNGAAVLSCLTLALECDGADVVTCESLAGGASPDPLVDAFDRFGASQCGFCTPGMLMSAKALLATDPHPSTDTVRRAISGNLCRCTGYGPIVKAIEHAANPGASPPDDGAPRPGAECMPAPIPRHGGRG